MRRKTHGGDGRAEIRDREARVLIHCTVCYSKNPTAGRTVEHARAACGGTLLSVLVDGQHHVTPLHLAADGSRGQVAEALLAAGGNPNAKSSVSVLSIALSLSMFIIGLSLSV